MKTRTSRAALFAVLGAATLMTAGCATETAYRPATGTGFARAGYSDRMIEANRYMVSFAGNSYTSRDTVERYLLYRSAELTVQHGFDYFILADRDTDRRTRTYATPSAFGGGLGQAYGYWGAELALSRPRVRVAELGPVLGRSLLGPQRGYQHGRQI